MDLILQLKPNIVQNQLNLELPNFAKFFITDSQLMTALNKYKKQQQFLVIAKT